MDAAVHGLVEVERPVGREEHDALVPAVLFLEKIRHPLGRARSHREGGVGRVSVIRNFR